MMVMTGTLTVNAAFLQEIKEDNRELHQLLNRAGVLLRHPAGVRSSAKFVVDVLNRLRDQLALHFSLEEAYGYFEDAVAVAPRLGDVATTLRDQHVELFQEVCELVDEAEQLLYREVSLKTANQLVRQFAEFGRRLDAHEAAEHSLILAAMHDDIGVGD